MRHRPRRLVRPRRAAALALAALAACAAPRARSLGGTPAPARLPDTRLPREHRRVVFRWEYSDATFGARGEGVARIAPPDSARLDFFLDGGLGGGFAILLGDSLFTPGNNQARRYLPPAPLLWSALGRLAVPASPDTTARVDGALLRADIGREPTWRATFGADRLTRLERIAGGRIREWVDRSAPNDIRYRNEGARRTLTLTIRSSDAVPAFDDTIWHR
jgi:hypothetical protein